MARPAALCALATFALVALAGCHFRERPAPGTSYGPEAPREEPPRTMVTRDLGVVAEGACALDELVQGAGPSCKRVAGEQATGSEPTTSANAWDANACTTWKAGGEASPFVAVDFGAVKVVSGVVVIPDTNPEITDGKHVFESSDDGENWKVAYVVEGKMAAARAYSIPFQQPVAARYLRVMTQKSDGEVGWREIVPVDCT